jgi:integration host factor subunit beta
VVWVVLSCIIDPLELAAIQSRAKVLIPEKRVPHFKPGKELRERVDYKPLDQKLVMNKGSSGA